MLKSKNNSFFILFFIFTISLLHSAKTFREYDSSAISTIDSYFSFLPEKINMVFPSKPPQPQQIQDTKNKINLHQKDYHKNKVKFQTLNQNKIESLYIADKSLIDQTEKFKNKKIIKSIIESEINLDTKKYDNKYTVYLYPDLSQKIINEFPELISTLNIKPYKNTLSDIISFTPENMQISNREICSPTSILLTIKNKSNKKLIITNVKTDLYQITIFLHQSNQYATQYFNPKINYPKDIEEKSSLKFQVIVLSDYIGEITGNIYFEFTHQDLINKNNVLVYPIKINSVENKYQLKPFYYYNLQTYKSFKVPVYFHNPNNETLKINELFHSFTGITLSNEYGSTITESKNKITSSNPIIIKPNENKTIIYINYRKDDPATEYGLIQLKTDKGNLVIPVLVNVDHYFLKFYPSNINFGLFINGCKNFVRSFPLYVTNIYQNAIRIKGIFINYNSFKYNSNYNRLISFNNVNEYDFNQGIILKVQEKILLGYINFDPQYLDYSQYSKYEQNVKLIKIKGNITLEIRTDETKMIDLEYCFFVNNSKIFNNYNENIFSNLSIEGFKNDKIISREISLYHKFKRDFVLKYSKTSNDSNGQLNINYNKKENDENGESIYNNIIINFSVMNITSFILNHNNGIHYRNIYLSPNVYFTFPINVYDNMIDLFVCNVNNITIDECKKKGNLTMTRYSHINYHKEMNITINFGHLYSHRSYFKEIVFENNNNNYDIYLKYIKSSSNNLIKIKIFNENNELIYNDNANYINIEIVPLSQIKIIIEFSGTKNSIIAEELKFYFSKNKLYSITKNYANIITIFTILVKAQLIGTLTLYPSNYVINSNSNFDKFSPDNHQPVSIHSNFDVPIYIESIHVNNSENIIAQYEVDLPYKLKPNENSTLLKIVNKSPYYLISFPNVNLYKNKYITFKELYIYFQINKKINSILNAKNEDSCIKIRTSLGEFDINIKNDLYINDIVPNNYSIDFGNVYLGSNKSLYITLYNPTDYPINVQPFIIKTEYLNEHFDFSKEFVNISANPYDNVSNVIYAFKCNFRLSHSDSQYGKANDYISDIRRFIKENNDHNPKHKKIINTNRNEIHFNHDLLNYIFVDKELLDHNANINKILYNSSNSYLKGVFNNSDKIYCDVKEVINKEDLLFEKYISNSINFNSKDLIKFLFNSNIDKDIPYIANKTENPFETHKENVRKVIDNLKALSNSPWTLKKAIKDIINDILNRKKIIYLTRANINLINELKAQEIFIDYNKSNGNIYKIKPKSNLTIGPITYMPISLSKIQDTLLIKNNLTYFTRVPLKGNSGSGIFRLYLTKSTKPIKDSYKIIIKTNKDIITSHIIGKNEGTFDLVIRDIVLENNKKENDFLRIEVENQKNSSSAILVRPGKSIVLNLHIKTNMDFILSKNKIIFKFDYIESMSLNVEIENEKKILYESLGNFFVFNFDVFKLGGLLVFIGFGLCIFGIEFISNKKLAERLHEVNRINNQYIDGSVLHCEPNKIENLFIKVYRKKDDTFYKEVNIKIEEFNVMNNKKAEMTKNEGSNQNKDTNLISNKEAKKATKKKTKHANKNKNVITEKKQTKKTTSISTNVNKVQANDSSKADENIKIEPIKNKTELSINKEFKFDTSKFNKNYIPSKDSNKESNSSKKAQIKDDSSQQNPFIHGTDDISIQNKNLSIKENKDTSKDQHQQEKEETIKEIGIDELIANYYAFTNPLEGFSQAFIINKSSNIKEADTQAETEFKNIQENIRKETSNLTSQNNVNLISESNPDDQSQSQSESLNPFAQPELKIEVDSNTSNSEDDKASNSNDESSKDRENDDNKLINPLKFTNLFDDSNKEPSINNENEKENNNKEINTSGGEEFNINFNSFFGNDITMPFGFRNNLENDAGGEEENSNGEGEELGDKPYFFNFNNKNNNNFIYSNNPFAIEDEGNNNQGVLKELYDPEDDEGFKGENDDVDSAANKADRDGEYYYDEDDEPEPEWGDDNVDLATGGYFDENGTYKLKNKI